MWGVGLDFLTTNGAKVRDHAEESKKWKYFCILYSHVLLVQQLLPPRIRRKWGEGKESRTSLAKRQGLELDQNSRMTLFSPGRSLEIFSSSEGYLLPG